MPTVNTTLLFIHDYLINAIGSQKLSRLRLLDLSEAIDTIDHDILLNRLSSWFCIHGTVLNGSSLTRHLVLFRLNVIINFLPFFI